MSEATRTNASTDEIVAHEGMVMPANDGADGASVRASDELALRRARLEWAISDAIGRGDAETMARLIQERLLLDIDPDTMPPLPPGAAPLGDIANAYRFKAWHGADARYVPGLGWLVWSGKHWEPDKLGVVRRLLHDAMQRYALAAEVAKRKALEVLEAAETTAKAQTDNADAQRALVKAKGMAKQAFQLCDHAARSQLSSRLDAALKEARSMAGIALPVEELDIDPWLLVCDNGTLDLRSGELRSHHREDYVTKLVPTAYDPSAVAPRWDAFIERIFDGKAELIAFVQRALGYSLSGTMREQVFFLLWGDGQNGKSTLLETVRDVLGEHVRSTAVDTLMATNRDRGPGADVARLRGARLITAAEAGERRRLDEERVKRFCGGDVITARHLYKDFIEFRLIGKLWLAVNKKPEIRGTDFGMWRRVRLVPFTVIIPKEERDCELPEKLRREAPGILAWLVRGCLAWQERGLDAPAEVTAAIAEYRNEEDVVGRFVAESCTTNSLARCGSAVLHKAFLRWADMNGEQSMSNKAFSARVRGLGFGSKKTKRGVEWQGLGLAAEDEDERWAA